MGLEGNGHHGILEKHPQIHPLSPGILGEPLCLYREEAGQTGFRATRPQAVG